MSIPKQTITVLSNGTGAATANYSSMIIIGPANSNSSTTSEIEAVSDPIAALSKFGICPLSEAAGFVSKFAGITYAIRVPASRTNLVAQALTKVGTGTGTVVVDGYSNLDYNLAVKIESPTSFKFTLDGYNYSDLRALVVGTFAIPNSGLTLTFGGTFVAGDIYSYSTVGPKLAVGAVASAFAKIVNDERVFEVALVYDGVTTSSVGSTLFGTLKSELASAANKYKFMDGIIDFGSAESSKAASIAAGALVESERISKVNDKARMFSQIPVEGYVTPAAGLTIPYAARVAQCLLSEDPGQVNRGPLDGVFSIENDQQQNDNGLDAVRFVTAMRHPGNPGFYITNSWLSSSATSDFDFIQKGRIMNRACAVTYARQSQFFKQPVRVVTSGEFVGAINPKDADRFETYVTAGLRAELQSPINSIGTKGHVTDVRYDVDLTNNILATGNLITTVSIIPFGYVTSISTTLSFAAQ